MSIDIQLARISVAPMLNDKGILQALDKGLIKLKTEISDDQLQPGSLDARIGEVYVFDDESREKYNYKMTNITSLKELDNYEPSRAHAKFYPDKLGQKIIIPPNAFAEIYLHEKPTFSNKDFHLSYELRSSRGRLALKPWSQYPKKDKSYYIELTNVNNENIILYGQDKFANLFFNLQRKMRLNQGRAVLNPDKVKMLLPEFAEQNLITEQGYVVFKVGKEAKTFSRGRDIDTSKSIDNSFYNTHDLSKGYILNTQTPAIVSLTPNINLPANLGIKLLHRIPFHTNMQQYGFAIADFNQVNAGWVDQGYNGAITAHPIYFMRPRILKEGDTFCFGILYQYNSDANRAYGSESLKSHYQNSTGATTSKS